MFILAEQGRFAEAERVIKEAIAIEPQDPFNEFYRAWLLQWMGRDDEALQVYCEALPREPNLGLVIQNEFPFHTLLRGRPKVEDFTPLDGFVEEFEENFKDAELPQLYHTFLAQAWTYAPTKRNLEKATEHAEEAVRTSGRRSTPALAALATVQFAQGAKAQAIRTLEEAIRRGSRRSRSQPPCARSCA